jgi:hypothetical protein
MNSFIRVSIAVVLIVGAGFLHGLWTGRWGPSAPLSALAERVETVPLTIGEWKGVTRALPDEERAIVGAVACLSRVYNSPTRGVSVSILLLGGSPGRIAAHTPEVCYSGAGYTLGPPVDFERRYASRARKAEFKTALATRAGTDPSVLRIIWGWNASNGWKAPAEPRWEFAAEPALCKLYVVRETSGSAANVADDPCVDFLEVLLPEIDRCVFSRPD